jgi:small subunit ribosomal protein S8
MTITDPVADFLTRIRNAVAAKHQYVDINWSKLKENIASVLKEKGFISEYLVRIDANKRGTLRIILKYKAGLKPAINGLRRSSKSSCRKYVKNTEIPSFFGGQGISILSTSTGVMDGSKAKDLKVGGELLCQVW